MSNEKYIPVKEFAEFLRITLPTIYKWIDKGMPIIQVNGRGVIRVPKFQALKWLEESTPDNVRKKN